MKDILIALIGAAGAIIAAWITANGRGKDGRYGDIPEREPEKPARTEERGYAPSRNPQSPQKPLKASLRSGRAKPNSSDDYDEPVRYLDRRFAEMDTEEFKEKRRASLELQDELRKKDDRLDFEKYYRKYGLEGAARRRREGRKNAPSVVARDSPPKGEAQRQKRRQKPPRLLWGNGRGKGF